MKNEELNVNRPIAQYNDQIQECGKKIKFFCGAWKFFSAVEIPSKK